MWEMNGPEWYRSQYISSVPYVPEHGSVVKRASVRSKALSNRNRTSKGCAATKRFPVFEEFFGMWKGSVFDFFCTGRFESKTSQSEKPCRD